MLKLPVVDCTRGAPMGRREYHAEDRSRRWKMRLERVPLVDCAYDGGGAYWGGPDNLYQCAGVTTPIEFYVRGDTREEAEAEVWADYPRAVFMPPALDEFTEGYITCALWCGVVQEDGMLDEPDFTIHDLDEALLADMVSDCKDFQSSQEDQLGQAYRHEGYTKGRAGHDFWLNRNGHGTGFWDRGLGLAGAALSDACRPYGGRDLYLSEDGKIYGGM